ncbi:MAG TPA: VTT domain-containing protein [Candidatus Paceibacterota bacterium]|nr:VTT domain-containing protein [Candidatus Paceibacterota bacterium]
MLNFLIACVHLDPLAIVKAGGYLGIAGIIFAESGLLIGILLPGDSLLFVAGLLAAGGFLSFGTLVVIVVLCAILGDSVGYWFGANVGDNLFNKKDSRFFKREYIERTEKFYERYGARTVMLARFVPIVRTIAPILAGAGSMTYGRFLAYNALGGALWGAGVLAVGYFLGSILPGSEHYVLPLSLVIVVLSFLPIVFSRRARRRA